MVLTHRFYMISTSVLIGIIASTASLNSVLKACFGMDFRPTQYMAPPLPPLDRDADQYVHLVVLVHGLFGNPDEVGTIRESLSGRSSDRHLVLVHSAICNHEKTTDGVVAGGIRLAREVNEWLANVKSRNSATTTQKITLSFVGNSLGGLYARYALALIDWTDIIPAIFCTTATPHLGITAPHIYLPIGSALEFATAQVLRETGKDLFRLTSVLQDMTINAVFVEPLSRFRRRIAVANAYYTDFQVPCSSGAFLAKKDTVPHTRIAYRNVEQSVDATASNVSIVMAVETKRQETDDLKSATYGGETVDSDEMARRLDVLGWTKIFCDVRGSLPSFPVPFQRSASSSTDQLDGKDVDANELTSPQLWERYATVQDKVALPFGHSMLIANSRDKVNARLNAPGKPIIDRLADDMVNDFQTFFP
jgi:Putative serine esterase (DUF676)